MATTQRFGVRMSARFLCATSAVAGAVIWATPALAECVKTGDMVFCDATPPNPERNGAIGRTVTLSPGAQVQLDDPYAGAGVRFDTVVVQNGGRLTTAADSRIGGVFNAVRTESAVTADISGAVSTARGTGLSLGERGRLIVNSGGLIATTGDGSPFSNSASGVVLASFGTVTDVRGTVRTSGRFAPAIDHVVMNGSGLGTVAVGAGGQVLTTGESSPAIRLVGGSNLSIAGLVQASGSASPAVDFRNRSDDRTGVSVLPGGRVTSASTAIMASGALQVTNAAGALIQGGGSAIQFFNGRVENDGVIVGDVTFNGGGQVRSRGTIDGNVRFAGADDVFVQFGSDSGVTGTIEGGDGADFYVARFLDDGTLRLGDPRVTGFESYVAQAIGAGTDVTLTGEVPLGARLFVQGDGSIANRANTAGRISGFVPIGFSDLPVPDEPLASFTNEAVVAGGFEGEANRFVNSGTLGGDTGRRAAVGLLVGPGEVSVVNTGVIRTDPGSRAVSAVSGDDIRRLTFDNSGPISGAFAIGTNLTDGAGARVDVTNSGSFFSDAAQRTALGVSVFAPGPDSVVAVTNSGSVETTGAGSTALQLDVAGDGTSRFAIVNFGSITASGEVVPTAVSASETSLRPSIGLRVFGSGVDGTVVNAATGTIRANPNGGIAVASSLIPLRLDNFGLISGGPGVAGPGLASGGSLDTATFYAGAIQAFRDDVDDTVRNFGAIEGSVDLGPGNDRFENRGGLRGDLFLRSGDDTFAQATSATFGGVADGGDGADTLVIDASTGDGTVSASQFVNFERVMQSGGGTVGYSGVFGVDKVELNGGGLRIAAGDRFATAGPIAIEGSTKAETVTNTGRITGSIDLGDGADALTNAGVIDGAVRLGAGADSFTEGVGSLVTRGVDGGLGDDLYRVVLGGDRAELGARTGFERLAVAGQGTLALSLDQSFDSVFLQGTSLNLTQNGFRVARVAGGEEGQSVNSDGDLAQVSLGGGDDLLSLGTATAGGHYDGGTGVDGLLFSASEPVALAGTAIGFETVALNGGVLAVSGTLGRGGDTLSFGEGDQDLTILSGGTLAGTIDLDGGADTLRLAAGARLAGTVSGGAGLDRAILGIGDVLAIDDNFALRDFERLTTEGAGTLLIAGGSRRFDTIDAAGGFAVGQGAGLSTDRLTFGAGDNQLTLAGRFSGRVDGGAGSDRINVLGGSSSFGSITDVEVLAIAGGAVALSGDAAVGRVDVTGGSLFGQSGTRITTARLGVGSGALFRSAGTLNGALAVSGTLVVEGRSGVTGSATLLDGSTTQLALTGAGGDLLSVAGPVSIQAGARLTLGSDGSVRPGQSFDLITASGGITGRFTSFAKPDSLFGFLVQRSDRISFLGQFLNGAGSSPQVGRSVDYVNDLLSSGRASPALLAALPQLLTASGATDAVRFGRLTPEAFASARQIPVENGLMLSGRLRTGTFGDVGEHARLFTFGDILAGRRTLAADRLAGTARAEITGTGGMAGLGFGSERFAVGGFVGYLDNRQNIDALDARTDADGVIGGVHLRATAGGVQILATAAYDGGAATTSRLAPGGSATSSYDLHGLTADLSVGVTAALSEDWSVRPHVGGTIVRVTRDAAQEAGSSSFALAVARSRDTSGFVDAGLTFQGGRDASARFHPLLALGARYQVAGTAEDALAGFGGGPVALAGSGAERGTVVATATAAMTVDLTSRFSLSGAVTGEAGDGDNRFGARAGFVVRF